MGARPRHREQRAVTALLHHTPAAERAPEQRARCVWCASSYTPRETGGRAQRFCAASCRREFERALRLWSAAEFEAGRVTVEALRG
jgi:hypothetical protein